MTPRVILPLLLLGAVAGTAGAHARKPARILFPVLGPVRYSDDFGAPRPGGPHQGIDILAPKRALALAAEGGRVKFWTTSATAGCMLYLYGASGTTYLYIHLNNDLTRGNDNRGKCVAGTAYANGLKNGARVGAGQPIGFVGDSGDADGVHAHLHFEVHPGGGRAVDPYPYLRAAEHLLFAAPPGTLVTLALEGTVVSTTPKTLEVKVGVLEVDPVAQHQTHVRRTLVLNVSDATMVQALSASGVAHPATLASAEIGQPVNVVTQPTPAALPAERGDPLALSAGLVLLSPLPRN
jgi:hypothetical protein